MNTLISNEHNRTLLNGLTKTLTDASLTNEDKQLAANTLEQLAINFQIALDDTIKIKYQFNFKGECYIVIDSVLGFLESQNLNVEDTGRPNFTKHRELVVGNAVINFDYGNFMEITHVNDYEKQTRVRVAVNGNYTDQATREQLLDAIKKVNELVITENNYQDENPY